MNEPIRKAVIFPLEKHFYTDNKGKEYKLESDIVQEIKRFIKDMKKNGK